MKFCPFCKSDLILIKNGDNKQTCCSSESCRYVYYNNPVPVVAAVVELGDFVVLVRSKGWPEGMEGIVAGFLEKGETPDESVLREVKEELGLTINHKDFIGYYSFFERNQVIFAYHILAEGEIKLCRDELDGYRLVRPEELKPWDVGTGQAVKDWLATRKK